MSDTKPMARWTLTIVADTGYEATSEGQCDAAQYGAALKALHEPAQPAPAQADAPSDERIDALWRDACKRDDLGARDKIRSFARAVLAEGAQADAPEPALICGQINSGVACDMTRRGDERRCPDCNPRPVAQADAPTHPAVARIMAAVWDLVRSGPNFDGRQFELQRLIAAELSAVAQADALDAARQALAAEVLEIARTGLHGDGDGVSVPTLLWAESWARRLGSASLAPDGQSK